MLDMQLYKTVILILNLLKQPQVMLSPNNITFAKHLTKTNTT